MAGFASAALQSAIFAALEADTALMAKINAVWDEPDTGAPYPYIVMGDGEVSDRSDKTGRGAQHRFRLDVWSDAAGRMEAKEIMDMAHDVLHDATLSLTNHTLVTIRFASARSRRGFRGGREEPVAQTGGGGPGVNKGG